MLNTRHFFNTVFLYRKLKMFILCIKLCHIDNAFVQRAWMMGKSFFLSSEHFEFDSATRTSHLTLAGSSRCWRWHGQEHWGQLWLESSPSGSVNHCFINYSKREKNHTWEEVCSRYGLEILLWRVYFKRKRGNNQNQVEIIVPYAQQWKAQELSLPTDELKHQVPKR